MIFIVFLAALIWLACGQVIGGEWATTIARYVLAGLGGFVLLSLITGSH